MQKIYLIVCMLLCILGVQAQTDYTAKITNPSFESDAEGWVHKGMAAQGNDVFNVKEGSKYMEKWTGRGGAVGDAYLRQEISGLAPGNYELTAVAQNIQEDTPNAAQTGAWIYAGDKKTTITVRDTYKVAFNYVSGTIEIGFEAQGASGNWIAVDNFRLTLVGSDLSAELAAAINDVKSRYGNVTGNESQQLKDAISAAEAVAGKSGATAQEQAAAITAMDQAIEVYLSANASADQPWNLTSRIMNPSFEIDGLSGWTVSGMGTQGNDVFNIKSGNIYVERWTGRGGAVGDARLSQRLLGMPAGRYRMKAAAQNIQEDTPKAKQTGAWIFAGTHRQTVTVRDTYTLEFVQVADEMEIGFEAKGATGNWLAVDNFQLEYIGNSFDDVKTAFATLISEAETIAAQRMNATAKQTLTSAISDAKTAQTAMSSDSGFGAAATALETAIATATTSAEVFARLATAITTANNELNSSSATLKDDYRAAITSAQGVYDAATTTDAQAEAAITALTEAAFAFKVQNGSESGNAPKVKTDPRFIKGCTWAFGRSTVTGSNIIEEGFCWSENPDPKVTDNRTTEYLNQAGKIYWLRDLKPGTMYYMRAYAINKDYAVGYGDVIKFATVPKGQVGHWYNNGGDEETNDRINYAINTAMDYYWNNLTSIHGFGISVSYSPGTPTADCGYGGGMRVGASSSYQQPGTIMHEALHGIGVGTHGIWWDADIHDGDWLGDRVTEALRFWDNSTTARIAGDSMHLWPYGCNGAHEDTHSDNLYCMMGILAQALNEDGLPASGEIAYALPYYSFNHEDGVKYYIKNEDESRGLRTSYLVENASHQLVWQTMTAEEAAENDAAAWYLSFKASNQYYQLKNAKTGYYMTYASGIKTVKHTSPTSADDFHLMRGRVDVGGYRGYYIIHPESSANPPTLTANASGKTATSGWDIHRSATTQRWLILTADEAQNFDNGNADEARKELNDLLAEIRKLAQTPHTEDVEGADDTLSQALSDIETQAAAATKGSELSTLTEQAREAAITFLSGVSVTDMEQPFDLTFMLENPNFDQNATDGWTSTNGAPGYGFQGAEFYVRTFDFYQTLEGMPAGYYDLHASAFQRPGNPDAIYTPYKNGTARITTSLYINSTTEPVMHICEDRQSSAIGNSYDSKMGDNKYVPNNMEGAEKYFAAGLYDSNVTARLAKKGKLKLGIKCTSAPSYYWTMFDSFRLYFHGNNAAIVGVEKIEHLPLNTDLSAGSVFDLSGRRIVTSKLPKGLYIVNGKKIYVK